MDFYLVFALNTAYCDLHKLPKKFSVFGLTFSVGIRVFWMRIKISMRSTNIDR